VRGSSLGESRAFQPVEAQNISIAVSINYHNGVVETRRKDANSENKHFERFSRPNAETEQSSSVILMHFSDGHNKYGQTKFLNSKIMYLILIS
jgi:hypothetical protein